MNANVFQLSASYHLTQIAKLDKLLLEDHTSLYKPLACRHRYRERDPAISGQKASCYLEGLDSSLGQVFFSVSFPLVTFLHKQSLLSTERRCDSTACISLAMQRRWEVFDPSYELKCHVCLSQFWRWVKRQTLGISGFSCNPDQGRSIWGKVHRMKESSNQDRIKLFLWRLHESKGEYCQMGSFCHSSNPFITYYTNTGPHTCIISH